MNNYQQKLFLLSVLLFGCVLTSIGMEHLTQDDEPIPIPPPAFLEQNISKTKQANVLKENSHKNQEASNSQNKSLKNKATTKNREVSSKNIAATININTASVVELDGLPGIGPVIAQRIVEHREAKPFNNIEEIMLVKGIGKKKFAKLRELITVE